MKSRPLTLTLTTTFEENTMSEVGMFKGNALVSSDLFKSLQAMNENLGGGSKSGGGSRRISLRGGKFRQMLGGEQLAVSKEDAMEIVIVDAARIARYFLRRGNTPPTNPTAPQCWSADTNAPSPDVPEDQRQAPRCLESPPEREGLGHG